MRWTFAMILLGVMAAGGDARAEVLWRGDFQTGDLSQWSGAQSASPGPKNWDPSRLSVVTDAPPGGRHKRALKVTLRAGDVAKNYRHLKPVEMGNRSELVRWHRLGEGDERWYAWDIYFPHDFAVDDGKGGGAIFAQWHHHSHINGEPGSPPIMFTARTDELRFVTVPALHSPDADVVWRTPLRKGKWHRFVFHVRFSSNPEKGLAELWLNGKHQFTRQMPTLFEGFANYLKMGLYRRPAARPDNVVWLAGVVEGTQRRDVEPAPRKKTRPAPRRPAASEVRSDKTP